VQIVLDTNILVSSLISKGTPPYQLQQAWLSGSFVLITSRAQLEEVKRVFGYEKLQKFITSREREELLANIESDAVIVEPIIGVSLSPDASEMRRSADFSPQEA
jgi:putative PIN family toxin of toxin-antitoxin system